MSEIKGDPNPEQVKNLSSTYSFHNPMLRPGEAGYIISIEIPFSEKVARLLESIEDDKNDPAFRRAMSIASGPVRDLYLDWPVPYARPVAKLSREEMIKRIQASKEKITKAKNKLAEFIEKRRSAPRDEDYDANSVAVLERILPKLDDILAELSPEVTA